MSTLTDVFLSIYFGVSYSHSYLKDLHRFYQGSVPFYYCDIYKATELFFRVLLWD